MTTPNVDLDSIDQLTRDLKAAAVTLSDREARYLVDAYYLMQENRIRAGHQGRTAAKAGEPHAVLGWYNEQAQRLEDQVKRALTAYCLGHKLSSWPLSVTGIGPILCSGLLAHLDVRKAPTAGHFWSFAGLYPGQVWEKGQKRPWNASLRALCWKIGESFVKTSGRDDAYYGDVWAKRKVLEIQRNDAGAFADQARDTLRRKRIAKTTDAYQWYSGEWVYNARLNPALKPVVDQAVALDMGADNAAGAARFGEWPLSVDKVAALDGDDGRWFVSYLARLATAERDAAADISRAVREQGLLSMEPRLPPAHIHSRAKRYAVKLFLSHLHDWMYRETFGQGPAKPYPIAYLGHTDMIERPNPSGGGDHERANSA